MFRQVVADVCKMVNCQFRVADWKVVLFRELGRDVVRMRKDAPGKQAKAKKTFDPERLKDPNPAHRVQKALDALFPEWKLASKIQDSEVMGYASERFGRRNVICTHSFDCNNPVILSRTQKLTMKNPVLNVSVASWDGGRDVDFRLQVRVNGKKVVFDKEIRGEGFHDYCFDLSEWRNKNVRVEVIQIENDWCFEMAWWSRLEIAEWDGLAERIRNWRIESPYLEHRQFEGEPVVRVQKTIDALFPGWKVSGVQADHTWSGYRERYRNRDNILVTHPVSGEVPCVLSRRITLPRKKPRLFLHVSSYGECDAGLKVVVNNKVLDDRIVKGDDFHELEYDLSEWAGRSVRIELSNYANDWRHEVLLWHKIAVE